LERLQNVQDRIGSADALEHWLNEQGLTKEQLKEQLREQILTKKVVDAKVRATVVVSPQEVSKEASAGPQQVPSGERVRTAHLLLRVGEQRSEEQARAQIQSIREDLRHGADFAALAKRYSDDAHAEGGGVLGWVARGQLIAELDQALFSLKDGGVSEPIQTRLGFHLVQALEHREASSLSVLEANSAVYDKIYQQKFEAALSRWVEELKRRAYIDLSGSGLE
jgi:peptidyl-prolyl cis-trans isomerase SurA